MNENGFGDFISIVRMDLEFKIKMIIYFHFNVGNNKKENEK